MAKEIPQNIMENNILTRLPVKSLIRFACVSKRWGNLILRNSKFAHKCQLHGLVTHRILVSNEESLKSLDFESPSWFGHGSTSNSRELSVPFEQPVDSRCIFLGSCNGPVFVAFDDTELFYVWNPATRFFKKLADIPCSSEGMTLSSAGYLSATDDYKVPAAAPPYVGANKVYIFSLRANIWRIVEINSGIDFWSEGQGTLSNGALHWLLGNDESWKYKLIAFDLAKEEFQIMELPDDFDDEDANAELLCYDVV